ncbi:enoyl-CoA hydratase/isomerase family protein [Granulicoccus phenolivorans]|uniref:enoyl-CoA hydratase/isomerase family protein n=1 Tax=Granulicoccus phenolivorans TaxID=266854 RepID=UPI00047A672C|nr:enoyl-CoA hydratase/isomerase family protein [Granulicoccus phenolivorans]
MSTVTSHGDGSVESTLADGILTVWLNRPDAMNAFTIGQGEALIAALTGAADPGVRVVVLRGRGGNFSVGGDFKQLQELQRRGRTAMEPMFDNFRRACDLIGELPKPVVCAVEGYAMAGGFELLQVADIVVVHEGVKLADTHSNHAMVPGGGSTQRLPRVVGPQRAYAHILTGDRLTAAEAVAWGLAYRAFPAETFEDDVAALAAALAQKDPVALATTKRLLRSATERPLADGLAAEREAVLQHLSGGATDGMDEFVNRKRNP